MRYANIYISAFLVMMIALFALIGCKKNERCGYLPEIELVNDSGYCFRDTTLKLGAKLKIGIRVYSDEIDNVTMFRTTISADDIITSVDSGMNVSSFDYERIITKGISDKEVWTFLAKTKSGLRNSISLTIRKDTSSVFDDIVHLPSITLDAQKVINGFNAFSFADMSIYTMGQAKTISDKIDFLYFYDASGDENTISSPGGNIDTSIYGTDLSPIYWSIRNTSRFELTTVTLVEFEKCNNDSLIYANTFEYASGKRKCKNLKKDDVYAFILNNDGRKGLFRVLSVQGSDNGSVLIEIKAKK
jgi:hypothetical protein